MTLPRSLLIILLIALVLRLGYGLMQDHDALYGDTGGDSSWYLANGYALVSGLDDGVLPGYGDFANGYPIKLDSLPTPPVYLIFVGLAQAIFPGTGAIIVLRIIQALLGTATCYFAYRLAYRITDNQRAGLLAAAVLAISPAFVLESAQITTETVYIFLITAALTLYVEHIAANKSTFRTLILTALLLGLATLTRALLLLFPLGLVLHLLMVYGLRASWQRIVLLVVIYALAVSTWTVYSRLRWDRWVIAGEGFAAFLYVGATEGGWQGPEAVDQAIGERPENDEQTAFSEGATQIILADPLGWAGRRVGELASAFLQPHGTLFFSGASLRDLTLDWVRTDRTLSGFIDLTRSDAFWPKLALYIFHYAGLLLGLLGIWLMRARWRLTLPLIGFIVYTALLHLLLTALPRYIFPTDVFWWVFASATFVTLRPLRV